MCNSCDETWLTKLPQVIEKLQAGEMLYSEDINTQLAFFDANLKVQETSRKRKRDDELLVMKRRKLEIAEAILALQKQAYEAQVKHNYLLQQMCTRLGEHTLAASGADDSDDESGFD